MSDIADKLFNVVDELWLKSICSLVSLLSWVVQPFPDFYNLLGGSAIPYSLSSMLVHIFPHAHGVTYVTWQQVWWSKLEFII
jgi:hypothetical protein